MSLTIKIRHHSQPPSLLLEGALGLRHRRHLMRSVLHLLASTSAERIQIDCSGITHIDYGGMQILKLMRHLGRQKARAVHISQPSRVVSLYRFFDTP